MPQVQVPVPGLSRSRPRDAARSVVDRLVDGLAGRLWFLLPQVVSRLGSVVVFAVVAHATAPRQLGAFTLATAISSASLAMAPAVVGKPLAAGTDDPVARRARGASAQSAALVAAVAVALALAAAVPLTSGPTRLALAGAAVGVPAVMAVESTYWRLVLTRGPRSAGTALAAAYAVQTAGVLAAALVLGPGAVALAPFVALVAPAVVLCALMGDLSWRRARPWFTTSRGEWLPYVLGVSAGVTLVQAVPTVLIASAGFSAASTYRAAELTFGGTNLLIGTVDQALMTRRSARPRSAYLRAGLLLALVAGANGAALALVPEPWLAAVVGPTASSLRDVLPLVTVQRIALGAGSVGGVLLVPLLSARRFGALDVVAAATALVLLVAGGLAGGLPGAVAGLALAETALAVMYGRLLWTRS